MEKKVILDQTISTARLIVNNSKPSNVTIALSDPASKIKFIGSSAPFEKRMEHIPLHETTILLNS
ncbi:MAG: hypothetical protein U5K54_05760 [Cytophagales bacterium]|nr:hypothetical protein [Cytophagales bacterium]